ncbi:hypothetical protein RND81_14G000500 [Saponaria officinalis]|uniref:Ulp1-like peptidase n=1 Tax=Saponaria officinalis TaxID=3572 RepID=A0AAW1GLA9_SAPOF
MPFHKKTFSSSHKQPNNTLFSVFFSQKPPKKFIFYNILLYLLLLHIKMTRKIMAMKASCKKKTKTTDEQVDDIESNVVGAKRTKMNVKSKGKKKVTIDERVQQTKKAVVVESDERDSEMSGSDDEDFEENVTTAVKVATQIGKTTKGKKHTGKSLDDVVTKKFEVGETSKKRQLEKTVRLKIGSRKDENAKKKVLAGHGSPAPLYELISMLTVAQKIDVEDIGFGGLLELKEKAFYHFMIDWLVEYYDHVSQMLLISEHNKFVITKHDVYDVFMLPCTEKTVKLTSNKKKDNPDTELVTLWRENFNVGPKDEISLERVKEEMLKLVKGGADFKKLFVIYTMGTFLAPTVHNRADLRLVTAVEDVARIGQQDWCSYVLDRLNFTVKSWRLNNSKSIGGCLFFLQLVYFHRLTWRGSPSKSTLPLLQHWTYEGLKKRMSEEMEAYSLNRGCFGIGTWDHNTYPVSLNQPKRFYRLSTKVATISEEEDDDTYLKIKLPAGVLSDRQLRQKYSDVSVSCYIL